jgi:Fe-S-cluster-containing hydrogenase component 2
VVGDVIEKMVSERAVVCDLCSTQLGQQPACVNACPHDAAWRIDARAGLPPR